MKNQTKFSKNIQLALPNIYDTGPIICDNHHRCLVKVFALGVASAYAEAGTLASRQFVPHVVLAPDYISMH